MLTASPLWQSYTLAFTWKSENLSLLVVEERDEGGATDCSYTAAPHTLFLSRIAPRYRRRSDTIYLTDRSIDLPLEKLTLDLVDRCIKYQPQRWGRLTKKKRKLPRTISMSLSRHYLNVFAFRKALRLAHRERTNWPCVTCNLFDSTMLHVGVKTHLSHGGM